MTVRWELIGATVGERNKLLYHSRAVIRNHLLYQKWIKQQLFAYCFIAVLWSRQSAQKRCRSLIGLRHNSSITVMSMGRTCRYPPPHPPSPGAKKKKNTCWWNQMMKWLFGKRMQPTMPCRRSPHGQHAEIPVTANMISPTLAFLWRRCISGLTANCSYGLIAGPSRRTSGALRSSKSTD